MFVRTLLSATALIALTGGVSAAPDMIGRTSVVVEQVNGELAPNVRRLAVQDDVYQNEVIATDENAASEIVFLDKTALALGPSTRMTLSDLVYDPRPSRQKLNLKATSGVFRFVTGAFAKQSYEIDTPTGTIGVRGTKMYVYTDSERTICEVKEGMAILRDGRTGEVKEVRAGERGSIGDDDGRDIEPLFEKLKRMVAEADRDVGYPQAQQSALNSLGLFPIPQVTSGGALLPPTNVVSPVQPPNNVPPGQTANPGVTPINVPQNQTVPGNPPGQNGGNPPGQNPQTVTPVIVTPPPEIKKHEKVEKVERPKKVAEHDMNMKKGDRDEHKGENGERHGDDQRGKEKDEMRAKDDIRTKW